MGKLREIYEKWQNDLQFRTAFKNDPEKALQDAGFSLSGTDLEKIHLMIKRGKQAGSSEKLEGRIIK